MRIDLVSEHASPLALLGSVDAGGQNVHVAALAQGLADLGHRVVVHTRRDDPAMPAEVPFGDGVVVHHVDAGPPEPIPKDELLPHMGRFADELAAYWTRRRPDVVHAHFWMSGLAAAAAADEVGVPVAFTSHALGVEKRRHQGADDTSPPERETCEAWVVRQVDGVIATTAAERRTLIGMGALPSRVRVVPCGVDLERFGPTGPTWPPPTGRHRVVCVSRLVPRKGLAEVVDAVAGLPDVELLIAGGPPAAMLAEDVHAVHLQERIVEHGMEDRAWLLGGLDREAVSPLMRSASVVCCTPWYEPFGLVAVEAMACGAPVVATEVGGLAETVVHGSTGLHVPSREPAAIRSAVAELLSDDGRRERMSAQAATRARRYGWGHIAEQSARCLRELADAGRRLADEPSPLDGAAATDVRAGGGR